MLPIAVQLYSLRNVQLSFDEILGQVAAIGYSGVETVLNKNLSAAEMQDLLDKHGLQVISAHVPLSEMDANLDGVIAFNKAVGNRVLVVPFLPVEERGADSASWIALGKRLDAIGQQVRAAGMQLLYHNHAFEMETIEGKLAIDWLMTSAAPENVGFEVDLAWVARGGQDGVAMLQTYAGRCPRVHCKDVAPEGENQDQMGFADVGHGTLDWSTILPAAKAAGAEWYIVEHDLPKEPMNSIQRSYAFLKSQLG